MVLVKAKVGVGSLETRRWWRVLARWWCVVVVVVATGVASISLQRGIGDGSRWISVSRCHCRGIPVIVSASDGLMDRWGCGARVLVEANALV